jgi:hypothetical protein
MFQASIINQKTGKKKGTEKWSMILLAFKNRAICCWSGRFSLLEKCSIKVTENISNYRYIELTVNRLELQR